MQKDGNFFEVGVSRHAPKVEKKGEAVNVAKQEVDQDAAQAELEQKTKALLENLELAPEGAVMALQPSNVKRAEQTRDLFIEKISELVKKQGDIELISLGETKESAERGLQQIRENPRKKYIITGLRNTWLIGFKDTEEMLKPVNEWKKRLGGDEHFLGKVWAVRPDETPELARQLREAGYNISESEINPAAFEQAPEEQVGRLLKWMQAMKKIGQNYIKDRPLILEGVSHNLRADFTSLFLLGEDISLESIDRVMEGKFREPYERSSTVFNEDGSVHTEYHGKSKDYSESEFEILLDTLYEKIEERKKEWLRVK